jgi:hypothetical protein
MNTVYFDSALSDRERLRQLYDGRIFVFSPSPGTKALIAHAAEMIVDAFRSTRKKRWTCLISPPL